MDGRVDLGNLARAVALVNDLPSVNFERAIASLLRGRVYAFRLASGHFVAITAAPGPTIVTAACSLEHLLGDLHRRPRRVVS